MRSSASLLGGRVSESIMVEGRGHPAAMHAALDRPVRRNIELKHRLSDKVDTETYKAFNRAVCEAVRRIKPMFVYEAMSRRPISTNMQAKTGSRKRSEMRVAR
jgi:hypothetical protein